MGMLIETYDLGKSYGDVRAVEHLSLRVGEGEIYAFLGLNGAGKTTTIRMLLGMIKPSSGYATVLQTRVKIGSREPWKSVGYMVEDPHAYPELTAHKNRGAPPNGLAGVGFVEIGELLLELTGQHGRKVFMSSHILAEVSHLAGRIG